MCCLHVLARVLAGAARRFADLVDQVALELREALRIFGGVREERVDPGVRRAAANEVVYYCRDGFLAAEAFVKRIVSKLHWSNRQYSGQ